MRFLFVVPFLLAAEAFAETRVGVQFGAPDELRLLSRGCTSASNLRSTYTRYIVSVFLKYGVIPDVAQWNYDVACMEVNADEQSAGTVEILGAQFDGSVFALGLDGPDNGVRIMNVHNYEKSFPILQKSHLFHNVEVYRRKDSSAHCYAMVPISEDVNAFDVKLEETDKFRTGWECRAIARGYVGEGKSGAPALGSENIVRLTSSVRPTDLLVKVDGEATDFYFGDKTDEEPSTSDDSEDTTTEPKEEATTPDDDSFKVIPRSCWMCRESLRRLDIPFDSAILPYLTPKMVNAALDDQDRQTERQQDWDDPSQVVPGCVKCQEFLNKLGIPSDSPIVPYLNTEILAAALNDMEENVSADEQPEHSAMPSDPPTPQEEPKTLFTINGIWTKITPIIRSVPIFFHIAA